MPASRQRQTPVASRRRRPSSAGRWRPRRRPAPRRGGLVLRVHGVEQGAPDELCCGGPEDPLQGRGGPGDPQRVVEEHDGVDAGVHQRAEVGLAAPQARREVLLLAGRGPALGDGEQDGEHEPGPGDHVEVVAGEPDHAGGGHGHQQGDHRQQLTHLDGAPRTAVRGRRGPPARVEQDRQAEQQQPADHEEAGQRGQATVSVRTAEVPSPRPLVSSTVPTSSTAAIRRRAGSTTQSRRRAAVIVAEVATTAGPGRAARPGPWPTTRRRGRRRAGGRRPGWR